MKVPLVMTVLGPDQPGLVDSVASLVVQYGGNWLESQMCRLGGQFAGLLQIEIDETACEEFKSALSNLSDQKLEIIVHQSKEPENYVCAEVATVEIIGQDQPGIVRHIANAFAMENVNVEELSTQCSSAPMSGERLFQAKAKVCIPDTCDTAKLRERLESIAADLQVDFSFESLNT